MAEDKEIESKELKDLQSKYLGTVHADPTKFEWLVNRQRKILRTIVARSDMVNYFAIAENESKARVRFNLMERMLDPCGPPPPQQDGD